MAQTSPWGTVQQVEKVVRGVRFVYTASHGGFLVSKGFAQKNLSIAAQKQGMEWNGYYAYEEDCLANIIFLEVPEARKLLNDPNLPSSKFVEALSYYNADYLIAVNIEPEPLAYARYLEIKEDERLRAEKSPDLIVSALSMNDSVVKVYTADGIAHFVTSDSYKSRLGLNLLSKCQLVTNFQQTSNLYF